jgi:DNA-binding CsgD family transcriptional regulator
MSFVIDREPATHAPAEAAAPRAVDAPRLAAEHWLAGLLDQIDYGLVVLDEAGGAVHVNRAAREWLSTATAPLRMCGGRVEAVAAQDSTLFRRALASAVSRGWRALLAFGQGGAGVAAAVGPLPGGCAAIPGLALLVIGRRHVCDTLTAQLFASRHGLTLAESQVLDLLCHGLAPREIARRQGVALSTVRTHIGSIRAKTHARSIGTLLREVALLPPSGHAATLAAVVATG